MWIAVNNQLPCVAEQKGWNIVGVNVTTHGQYGMRFQIGQAVTWSSQANGNIKIKAGVVAQVVGPDERPDRERFPSLYSSSGCGLSRKAISYVIVADERAYWPRVTGLQPVVSPLDERVCPGCVGFVPAETESACPHCGYEFDRVQFPTIREIMSETGKLNDVSPAFIVDVVERAIMHGKNTLNMR